MQTERKIFFILNTGLVVGFTCAAKSKLLAAAPG
jgi:hypothetical protein